MAETVLLPPKAVIYATNFSSSSENAGRYAALMASRFNTDLIIAHAVMLSQAALELEASSGFSVKSMQRRDIETALNETVQKFAQKVACTRPILLQGSPDEQIPRLARENAPALIVLGTQARSRIDRGLVGSEAERILRSADCPVLTVGPNTPVLTDNAAPIRRILYATDLSSAFARGAGYAAGLAKTLNAELEVLHVVQHDDAQNAAKLRDAQQRLAQAMVGLKASQAEIQGSPEGVVESGTAHLRILEHIQKSQIDLLVLSVHHSSHLWLESRLSGAFSIVAQAACPTITLVG